MIVDCAHRLEGAILNEKWTVVKKMEKNPDESGGYFSIGYVVEDFKGNKAFLKAIDYSKAFSGKSHSVQELYSMSKAYLFEVQLLEKCFASNLRYVVKMLDYGEYRREDFLYSVPFMIFEYANTSARKQLNFLKTIDYAWMLRSLHNVAVGIQELHNIDIAHQDVKPSNVMIFGNLETSKMGDVGRSSTIGSPADHDIYKCAGDKTYSPLEQLYGLVDTDWRIRRFSCDMYMFGNLIYTYFNSLSITMVMMNKMPIEFVPTSLNGKYIGDYKSVLPLLLRIFDEVVDNFNTNIDEDLRSELIALVKQLCHPDYKNCRGDLKKTGAQHYSMERFISAIDMLCRKYEYKLRKGGE